MAAAFMTAATFPADAQQPSRFHEFSTNEVEPNGTGWAFWFIPIGGQADTLSVKMSYVDRGVKTHDPHHHNPDELFVMIEGESVVTLNGEEQRLQPGDAFYAVAQSSHNISRTDMNAPIKYVMFKRETKGEVPRPYPVALPRYTMKDCYVPYSEARFSSDSGTGDQHQWLLTPEMTLGGLSADLRLVSDERLRKPRAYHGQQVVFIVEGEAEVTVGKDRQTLHALASAYVPARQKYTIRKKSGKRLRYILVRTN